MMPVITGYKDQEGVRSEIDYGNGAVAEEFIETEKMNFLEFACVRGCSEILKFLVNDIGFNRKENFNLNHNNLKIEQMPFIQIPI